jgi:hypothetical protein
MPGRRGGDFRQRRLIWGLFFAVVTLVALSCPQMFFEPLALSYRLADLVLLAVGLLGSLLMRKTLRIMGWVGIALFILYVVFGSIPSLDHPALDALGQQRPGLWLDITLYSSIL